MFSFKPETVIHYFIKYPAYAAHRDEMLQKISTHMPGINLLGSPRNVSIQNEAGNLMKRLLNAVKECQARFGGKSELATESDSRVSVLCAAWEAVLQHGLIHSNKTLSTIKQVTEITGLSKIGTGISMLETEPVFWHYVKGHLSRHDIERYMHLASITTDAGRGRAWLRSAMNEHSLEKYMHMMVEDDAMIGQYYESWAFLKDQEKRNTLPNMARGLDSILFAISIDQEELNTIKPAKGFDDLLSPTYGGAMDPVLPTKWLDHRPVIGGDDSQGFKKEKKKKKKVPKIVSFDDVEYSRDSSSSTSSVSNRKSITGSLHNQLQDSYSASLPSSGIGEFGVTFGSKSFSENLLLRGGTNAMMVKSLVAGGGGGGGSQFGGVEDVGGGGCEMGSMVQLGHQEEVETDQREEGEGRKSGVDQNGGELKDQDSPGTEEASSDKHQKASVFRKMFSFGTSSPSSSSTELHRTTSRTSLDSVQSSKSEQGPPDEKQSPKKKGHRKSHSDTSMFSSASIGSRIFKTVVEETKRRFAFSETEGSLQSSRASSTKSLNEETSESCKTGTITGQQPLDSSTVTVNRDSNILGRRHSNVSENTNLAALTKNCDTGTQPVSTSSVQIAGVQYPIQASIGSQHPVSSQKSGLTEKPGSIGLGQSAEGRDTSFLTGRKTASSTSLGSYDNISIYNGEAGNDLTPLSPDGLPLSMPGFHPSSRDSPISQDTSSIDSSELQSYTEVTQQATLALALAQKGVNSELILRTQGDGSHFPDGVLSGGQSDGMTSRELKEAIIAMMMRKDEVEEQNKHLKFALETELEVNAALRLEIEEMKRAHHQRQDRDTEKIRDVSRENDLLKHQLKKYVSAVQLLRRRGADSEDFPGIHIEEDVPPAIPPTPVKRDYSREAEEYEKKLIQVAEMHGELMEFNENLHRQILSKEKLIRSLQQELTDLRGPLPADMPEPDDDLSLVSDIDGGYVNRPLINMWIPSAFLKGKPSDGYHVYQVFIRIRDEEWNIYRRYNEFLDMHVTFKKTHPIVATFEFPPKKALGNKGSKFVEMRRKKLQVYLRKLINYLSRASQEFTSGINREKLAQYMPFFADQVSSSSGNRRKTTGANTSQNTSSRQRPVSQPHYSGL